MCILAEDGLCTSSGIFPGTVTKRICDDKPKFCEVYISKGKVKFISENAVDVKSCTDYCQEYNLQCVAMHEGRDDTCEKRTENKCDFTGVETSNHICTCSKPS